MIHPIKNPTTDQAQQEEEVFPPLNEEGALTDDERLDESIAESFPASDPPSWSSGVDHHS